MSSRIERFDGKQIDGSRSRGSGVFAAFDWEDMVLCPASPIEEKAKSEQSRLSDFPIEDHPALTRKLGHYSKVQSANSEDTVTWSVFGAYALHGWISDLLDRAFNSNPHGPDRKFWQRVNVLGTRPESDLSLRQASGPIRATRVNVIVAKLEDYSEFAQGVDGLIGLDLLSRGKKLSIDYERQIVSFDATQDGGPSPSRSFVVPITVQGVRMSLLVDTGLCDVMLYKDKLRKGLPNIRTEGESRAALIGRLHATQVNLPGVKIVGPETVAMVFLIDRPGNGDPSGIDGYLGPLSLHARRIEMDFVGHRFRWQ